MEELARHRQQVIQGQEQGGAQLDNDQLLGRGERGVQTMGTMSGIRAVVASPPVTHCGAIQVVLAGQFPFRLGGFAQFLADGRCGTRVFMPIQIHRWPVSGWIVATSCGPPVGHCGPLLSRGPAPPWLRIKG